MNALAPVVQLDWVMKDGTVTVTPREQDRFVLKMRRAIEILQQAGEAERFHDQFNLLLRMLAEWLRSHQDAVAKAYLTDRDGALAFVVVRTSCEYDDDFEDVVSELDFRVANDPDLNLLKMDVIALPLATDAAITSFIDPGFVFEYVGNGNRSGSHSAGEQEPRRTASPAP
jgi:hypothetical protein